jgi:two-component system chemotaxis response regulator CheY
MKILSIDDSKTIRATVKSIVDEIGIELLEAEDGLAGLKVLEEHSGGTPMGALHSSGTPDIDLILLDWEMPNMNGYEFLKTVKMDSRYRSIPVIMLTSVSQKERMIEAISSGAEQYLTKPFTSETLLTKIVQVLGIDSLEGL